MLTIQRSFFPDKQAALQHGLELPVACSKLWLYRAIAQHLGLNVDGIDDHTVLMDMIDQRNIELACIGVPMTANIDRNKPVLRRDRQPLPKPVKRPVVKVSAPKPIKKSVVYVAPGNTMAKALMAAKLIQVV